MNGDDLLLIVTDDATGIVLTEAVRRSGYRPVVRTRQSSIPPAIVWWDADRYTTAEVLPMLSSYQSVIAVTVDPETAKRLLDNGWADMVMMKPVTMRQVLDLLTWHRMHTAMADDLCRSAMYHDAPQPVRFQR